jgi:hypothetical protein
MPLTNADNPTAAAPVERPQRRADPVLIGTGNSSNPDVQHLASRRAHLVGALASGPANSALADEIEAIDKTLAELGYRA